MMKEGTTTSTTNKQQQKQQQLQQQQQHHRPLQDRMVQQPQPQPLSATPTTTMLLLSSSLLLLLFSVVVALGVVPSSPSVASVDAFSFLGVVPTRRTRTLPTATAATHTGTNRAKTIVPGLSMSTNNNNGADDDGSIANEKQSTTTSSSTTDIDSRFYSIPEPPTSSKIESQIVLGRTTTSTSTSSTSSSTTTTATPSTTPPTPNNSGPINDDDYDNDHWSNVWTRRPPISVQGGSLRTWTFNSEKLNTVQVYLKTAGRPLNANVELWQGPDNNPQQMSVYLEDGNIRPFIAMVATPGWMNSLSIRNTAQMAYPLEATLDAGKIPHVVSTQNMQVLQSHRPYTIQGGAVFTKNVSGDIASVQILLTSEGRPMNAMIEVIQGPNSIKQVVDIYTEDGQSRPLYLIVQTPGYGSTIRIKNTSTMEFPIDATVEPYEVEQSPQQLFQISGGVEGNNMMLGGQSQSSSNTMPAGQQQQQQQQRMYVPRKATAEVSGGDAKWDNTFHLDPLEQCN